MQQAKFKSVSFLLNTTIFIGIFLEAIEIQYFTLSFFILFQKLNYYEDVIGVSGVIYIV